MTTQQAHQIVDEMDYYGIPADVLEEYSGRGMCGKTCPAISCENPAHVHYFAGRLGLRVEELPLNRDDLGKGYVVY